MKKKRLVIRQKGGLHETYVLPLSSASPISNERDVLDGTFRVSCVLMMEERPPPTAAGENAWQLFAAIARRQETENFMRGEGSFFYVQ